MIPRIKKVTPLSNYRLKLIFTNREWGIYDCSSLLNFGVFQELQNIHYFNQVKIIDGTVVWPHEQDISPDTLYLDSLRYKD
jgi:hypothetical protein